MGSIIKTTVVYDRVDSPGFVSFMNTRRRLASTATHRYQSAERSLDYHQPVDRFSPATAAPLARPLKSPQQTQQTQQTRHKGRSFPYPTSGPPPRNYDCVDGGCFAVDDGQRGRYRSLEECRSQCVCRRYAIFYMHEDWRGSRQRLAPGKYELGLGSNIGSIKVPPGMRVRLYPEPNFAGRPVELTKSIPSYQYLNIATKPRSMEIVDLGGSQCDANQAASKDPKRASRLQAKRPLYDL